MDDINSFSADLFQQPERVQIISLKDKIIGLRCDTGNFSVHVFGEYGNVITHHYICGFFMLFPDKPAFLAVSLLSILSRAINIYHRLGVRIYLLQER